MAYTTMLLGNIVWDPETSPWQECAATVGRRNYWQNNHAMVRNGKGFWKTDTVIVTGYVLKGNTRVFRPVFQFMRNKRLEGVLNTIKDRIGNGQREGGKFMAILRQNLARRAMLGLPLPVTVIMKIGTYV